MFNVLYAFADNNKSEIINSNISITYCADYTSVKNLLICTKIDLLIVDGTSKVYSGLNFSRKYLNNRSIVCWFVCKSLDEITIATSFKFGIQSLYLKGTIKDILPEMLINYFENNEKITDLKEDYIIVNKLKLSITDMTISYLGGSANPLKLQQKQFDILKYLMENANRIVTISQIWEKCWGEPYDDKFKTTILNTIHNQIFRLREYLNHFSDIDSEVPNYLQTIHGKGYKFLDSSNLTY